MHSRSKVTALYSLLFCSLFAVSEGMAQNQKPSPPHEPLLPRAPEMANWTIMYQYSAEKDASDKKHKDPKKVELSNSRITSIEIVKTGAIYHKITHWNTGEQNEVWSVNGREMIKENGRSQYIPMPTNGPIADDYTVSDFEDLNWLSMKYYVGLKQGGHGNFVFHAKRKNRPLTRREKIVSDILKSLQSKNGEAGSPAHAVSPQDDTTLGTESESPDAEDTIVLDATNQLPVEYEHGSIKWTYQFNQPPTSQLEPPTEVSKLLENWDNFIKSTQTTGSPP